MFAVLAMAQIITDASLRSCLWYRGIGEGEGGTVTLRAAQIDNMYVCPHTLWQRIICYNKRTFTLGLDRFSAQGGVYGMS